MASIGPYHGNFESANFSGSDDCCQLPNQMKLVLSQFMTHPRHPAIVKGWSTTKKTSLELEYHKSMAMVLRYNVAHKKQGQSKIICIIRVDSKKYINLNIFSLSGQK